MSVEASTRIAGELAVDPMTDLILEQVTTRHEWRAADGEAHGLVERALT
jgi:hypothetical protein